MNWPDPSRPGVPLNPQQSGWHWVIYPADTTPTAREWHGTQWDYNVDLSEFFYLGPVGPPGTAAIIQRLTVERDDLGKALAEAEHQAELSWSQGRRQGLEEASQFIEETIIPILNTDSAIYKAMAMTIRKIKESPTNDR